MRISVSHTLGDLERDLKRVAGKVPAKGPGIVRKHVNEGSRLTRAFARKAAGPHGADYFKRISSEMTGPFTGEYGPSALLGERYVGVDSPGGPDRDLDRSVQVVGPKFRDAVADFADGLFW